MQKKILIGLLINFFTLALVFSQENPATNTASQEPPRFQHLISFMPLPFVSAFANGKVGIPIRYELGLPDGHWGLGIYNGIQMKFMEKDFTFYDEIRFGPRYLLYGKNQNGLFTRLNVILGFGTIPYNTTDPASKTLYVTPQFLYGGEWDIGYTMIVDIGFMVEGYIGVGFKQQSLNGVNLNGEWFPIPGIQVGWSF